MRRIRRKAEEWKHILEDFENTGLSPEDYCKDKDYSESSLYAWKRRLFPKKPSVNSDSGFVQLVSPIKSYPRPYRIETPNGYRIDIPHGSDGHVLKELLPILLTS